MHEVARCFLCVYFFVLRGEFTQLPIKKPASFSEAGLKISFSVLTELVKYFNKVFSNHLRIPSFDVVTFHKVE